MTRPEYKRERKSEVAVWLLLCLICVSSAVIFHGPVFQNIAHVLPQRSIFDAIPQLFPDCKGIAFLFYEKAFAGSLQKFDGHGLCFAQMLFVCHAFVCIIGQILR